MKRKHMVRAAAAVLACAALTGAALALSTGDSLISLSYLNDTYIPTVVAQGTKAADEKLIQAYQAASQKLDEVNQGYGVQQGSGGSYSADLRSRDMVRGDQLKLPTGSVVQLAAGAGTVVHTGAVIDVTAGQTVASGAALVSGHRYLVGEDTSAVFTVDSGLAKVGVQGSFEKTESGEKAAPFTDVSRSDWYSSAVDYVYFEQLFSGTGDGLFSPMASMDRAMIVTVFYNMAGAPQGEMDASTAVFSDVPAGQWYAPYVSWAADQGVTAGTGEDTFSPEQAVTRREAVALLYSFGTNYLGLELTERADLTPYEDAAAVASWGGEAVAWAVGAGLPPYAIEDILVVVKAYSSAVGAGAFVSEIFGDEAQEMRIRGGDAGEFGATTGRPRRMGWFDCVASRYGVETQGATRVALTVIDALGYLDEIPVCVGYEVDGKVTRDFPTTPTLSRAKPVLEVLPGWKQDVRGITRYEDLPANCRAYIEFIEKELGVPVAMVSNGPGREELIRR